MILLRLYGIIELESVKFSAPLHHQAIRGLLSQYPTYPHAVRLLQCWACGHLLTGFISQEELELIVASVYLNPDKALPPSTAIAGFAQSLKKYVITHHSSFLDYIYFAIA